MNLPNKLTVFRILLTFVFMYFLFSAGILAKVLAILVFILASVTDYCDGWMARKRNLISNFGKLMDPIADKILVLAAFLAFVELRLMPAWMMIIILSRELLITGVRLLALSNGIVLAAGMRGKHKTVSQFLAIVVTLLFIFLREVGNRLGYWTPLAELIFKRSVFVLLVLTTFLTLISGVSFLYQNRSLMGIK